MIRKATTSGTTVKLIDGNVFVRPTFGTQVKVGRLDNGRLKVSDMDNYHHKSKSLGVDEGVLFSTLLNYTQIHFKFHGYPYATTRKHFAETSRKRSLMNGRSMMFLPLKKLNLGIGLAYDKHIADTEIKKREYPSDLAKWDVFDVFLEQIKRGITNNRLFNRWEKLINGNQTDNGRNSTSPLTTNNE